MADGRVLCDYGLHVTVVEATPERLAEIPALLAAGVPTFKGFLAYKGRLMLTPAEMSALMDAVTAAGGLLLVHAEDGEMNATVEAELLAAGRTAPRWHPDAHPVESEVAGRRPGAGPGAAGRLPAAGRAHERGRHAGGAAPRAVRPRTRARPWPWAKSACTTCSPTTRPTGRATTRRWPRSVRRRCARPDTAPRCWPG